MNHVKINAAAEFHCSPDWYWDTAESNWDDFDIWAILDGYGRVEQDNGQIYNISRGDCFVLRSCHRYQCSHQRQHPLKVICVHFDYMDDSGVIFKPEESRLPPLHRHFDHFTFMEELIQRIMISFLNPSGTHTECEFWLQAVLLEIKNHKPPGNINQEQNNMINCICDNIIKNPGFPYRIKDLADTCSYSADHFARVFKYLKNTTPQEFIINARINSAKILLRNSSYSVGKIAELTGYEDIYHFSKQFHQRTGTSPTGYRRPLKT